jgi:hypothetical protein
MALSVRSAWLGLLLSGVASIAHAQEASSAEAASHAPTHAELAEARHSFDVATHAFESGDYETAVSEFRTALELSGAADLYFNIYLSEERAGNLQEAADALDQYLQRGTIDDEQRHLLEGRLERLRSRVAARTPAPAAPEEPQTLLASPIATAPTPEATPEPTPEPSPPPPPPGPPEAAIGVLIATGVFLVGFGVFGSLSLVENDRLANSCGSNHGRYCPPSSTSTLFIYDVAADVSWIGAAALGVIDLVLWLALPGGWLGSSSSSPSATASVRARPIVRTNELGVSIGGTF